MSLAARLAGASAALDVQTGGGEVLDFALGRAAPKAPVLTVATEGWPANLAKATALLRPRGIAVVATAEDAPLPFADASFDLVEQQASGAAPVAARSPASCSPAGPTSPNTWARAACSSSSSTSSDRSRGR